MTDPLDALRTGIDPVDPDPTFAARLRERLRAALLSGGAMTDTGTGTELAWGPALSPYLTVGDGRRALDWYAEVFDARPRGEAYVMPDGSIGHAELAIGDAVLMLSEGSGGAPVAPPAGGLPSVTIHLQVPDVDATVRRASTAGATVEREPDDQPYGRMAAIVDPFGHRWLLNQPPPGATRYRHGDIAYVSILAADVAAAKAFYGAVLGWRYSPGSVESGWHVEGRTPGAGLARGGPEVELCYRVSDVAAAAQRVREHGGQADEVMQRPYGLMADCTDDQGTRFQLWQPAG
jgi:predicted enzyme related to lactoylglutathione lyase